jgi:hypothetical protein
MARGDIMTSLGKKGILIASILLLGLTVPATTTLARLDLGAEEIVQAAGQDLVVDGYSVPCYVDWDNDGLPDLVVGEGADGYPTGKVRVYLNVGSRAEPAFDTYFHVQSEGVDLSWPALGCLGLFPRVMDWDGDGRKDLLVGTNEGLVRIYLNVGTDSDPAFDAGTTLQFGLTGDKVDIDVGDRATPVYVDWDNDGQRDLLVGSAYGFVYKLINEGSDTSPDFLSMGFVAAAGGILEVPGYRSSPVIQDLDDDGKKDLLTGNTEGELLLFVNEGSDAAPYFSTCQPVAAAGVAIDLPGEARSRPFVCDWTGDGNLDVLIGADDGRIHLYQGLPDLSPVALTPAAGCRLLAAWPNPCNPRVTITFELDREVPVELSIWNLAGARVRTLIHGVLPGGLHEAVWNGRDESSRGVASGVYLYRLQTGSYAATGRLALVR